jgi:hypothetical protein
MATITAEVSGRINTTGLVWLGMYNHPSAESAAVAAAHAAQDGYATVVVQRCRATRISEDFDGDDDDGVSVANGAQWRVWVDEASWDRITTERASRRSPDLREFRDRRGIAYSLMLGRYTSQRTRQHDPDSPSLLADLRSDGHGELVEAAIDSDQLDHLRDWLRIYMSVR